MPRTLGLLVLVAACNRPDVEPQLVATQSSKTPAPASSAPSSTPAVAAAASVPATLEEYLASAPERAPTLTPEITGTLGDDPDTKIPRCMETGWSYHQCATVYPMQGRVFLHWQCARADAPEVRDVACSRLAEYLEQGIGGPVQTAWAEELRQRQPFVEGARARGTATTSASWAPSDH